MMELTLARLPGGDPSRRHTIVRITLTNTGEGVDPVRVYAVRVVDVDGAAGITLHAHEYRTHRDSSEDVLRLVYRSLGRLLGESA